MRTFLLISIFFISTILFAQAGSKRISREEYINTYKEDAIIEMQRTGIPASITLAQGILESGDGNSPLARYAKNHFGIKCHSDWKGATFTMDDDAKDECFRKYKHVLDSYRDHSDFLTGRNRYAFLFDLKITDYKGWAHGLKKAGYATNPKYPSLLIGIIERNQLYQYDDPKAYKKSNRQIADKGKSSNSKSKTHHKNTDSSPYSSRTGMFTVKTHPNNIKYVEAKGNQNLEDIADEFNMGVWQLTKYNDLDQNYIPKDGEIVYLQPKRYRGQEDFYIVQSGESLEEISQKVGVRLKSILRKNRIDESYQLKVGEKLYLKRRKPRE